MANWNRNLLKYLRETNGPIEHKMGRGSNRNSGNEEVIDRARTTLRYLQPGQAVGTRKIAKRTKNQFKASLKRLK